jgi:ribosomal protein S18 acetylase RimI-like enzyme
LELQGENLVHIQQLLPSDYDIFYKLRLDGLEQHPDAYATDAQAWKSASKETIERLLVNSQEKQDMPIIGAWVESQLVGLVGMNRDLRPSVAHKATLWGLFVSPPYRRQHIGRALVTEILARAQTISELTLLRAVVNINSVAALMLLMQSGFKEYGREPNAKKIGETFYDQIYLWYDLDQNRK